MESVLQNINRLNRNLESIIAVCMILFPALLSPLFSFFCSWFMIIDVFPQKILINK